MTPEFPFIKKLPKERKSFGLQKAGRPPIKIGIPSRGEMLAGSTVFLEKNGWPSPPFANERQVAAINSQGDTAIKVRPADMTELLVKGNIDAALIGADVILKSQLAGKPVIPIAPADFGRCQLRIGFPYVKDIPLDYETIKQTLESGLVATSMPEITRYLLGQSGINILPDKFFHMSGSVEAGPTLEEKVVAVADLVVTGNSMRAANLRPDLAIQEFEAYLAATDDKLDLFTNVKKIAAKNALLRS